MMHAYRTELLVSLLLTGMVASSGCGYNDLQGLDE